MLIDWFTVGAQALNFIVLVWLLKRFLYKPVLSAIDAREKRIADELADAERQKSELQTSRDELQAKSKAFDDERNALFAKATLDAKAEGERLSRSARQAAEALTLQRNAAVQNEAANLSLELARLAAAESIGIARAVLKDLAGADLEERISAVFARRVRGMDAKTKESMAAALRQPNSEPVVTSSFALSEREKGTLQTALNETFSVDIHLRFETSSTGIGGIEFSAAGQRLSWSIAEYLRTLEEKAGALLNTTPDSAPVATAAPAAAAAAVAVTVPNREAPAAAA
jgi:F-type H+-transporting ATPase subunit b